MKKGKSNIYFGKELQKIIIQYNQQTDPVIRQELYKDHIDIAFRKIANALIFKYKIQQRIQNSQTLLLECLSNMIQKADGFDPTRGSGFTYFTVIARNFILEQLDKGIRHNDKFKSINQVNDDGEQINLLENCSYEHWNHERDRQYSEVLLSLVFTDLVKQIEQSIIPHLKNQKQVQVANAVLQLIRDVDLIENFNRKAIMLYITEMTQQNSELINKVLKIIGKSYYRIKTDKLENSLQLLTYQYI